MSHTLPFVTAKVAPGHLPAETSHLGTHNCPPPRHFAQHLRTLHRTPSHAARFLPRLRPGAPGRIPDAVYHPPRARNRHRICCRCQQKLAPSRFCPHLICRPHLTAFCPCVSCLFLLFGSFFFHRSQGPQALPDAKAPRGARPALCDTAKRPHEFLFLVPIRCLPASCGEPRKPSRVQLCRPRS